MALAVHGERIANRGERRISFKAVHTPGDAEFGHFPPS
jgi:hypothetical protein